VFCCLSQLIVSFEKLLSFSSKRLNYQFQTLLPVLVIGTSLYDLRHPGPNVFANGKDVMRLTSDAG